MLTRHSVIAESSHLEAVPINLVATEDGRTILAVTERKDGVLEIVAAPVTLIGQTGTTASLVDVKNYNEDFILQSPVFQISLGNIHGSELEQSVQSSEVDPEMTGRTKVESNEEAKCLALDLPELDRLAGSDSFAHEKNSLCRKHSSAGTSVTKSSQGRPRKDAAISSQVVERLKCDICQQEFTKQTLYRRHMENHAEEKPHRCPKCSASFNIPTNFTLHMATHNTGEPKCPECGRKFARMASLKSHMLLHEKEENLFCTECEDAFLTKAQLDAHLKLHGEKWTSEETRKCKLCNKQFGQPALYRLHIREHYRLQTKIVKQTKRGAKHKTMYKCTICLKSFQKPSQLMRHIRVHTGEKPFKCTVCSRAFTQKSSLQIHTWQHNGIRPHACEFCNAKFSQKGNLNAHIMRVHNIPEGEPIYGCTYCSCIFKKLGSLNGHMKRVHAETTEGNVLTKEFESADAVESDIRATVDSVITQLASLESNSGEFTESLSNCNSTVLSGVATKKDILQQALKNSGLPSKMKALCEGSSEMKRLEARTNFVTLLDRAPDGGTRKYLTIKQRCVGNVRWYACTFCHKEFKKPSDLIRHLRVHTQEKPFKCTHCYRSFALKSTLIAHERTHSGTKRYACGSCDKTFACQGSLVAHIRLHAKPGECSNKVDLNDENNIGVPAVLVDTGAHLPGDRPKTRAKSKSKLSPEAESLVPEVVLQEPLVISDTGNKICVAQVPSKEKRAYDAATDPARPHKCWVCHAAFRKISHLKQHHRRHTGERPYKCTKCDRRFTSNSVLKSHLHTHEDSRPYGCPVCNARFSTQSSTKRHLVTHSNKRPFMCPYCHKTFKTYVNCRKHMKIHKHELAQRQLEQRRIQAQEPIVSKSDSNESDKRGTAPETPRYVSSSFSDTCTDLAAVTAAAAAATTTTILTASSSRFSDSMEGSRIDPVEISFQPQIAPDFSQAFSDQLQTVTDRKEKARPALSATTDTPTTVNGETGSDMAITGLENAQLLHVDETGSVTLPVYSGDRALTPESIREIEETLNQQLFNIGMNLSLESSHHSDHSNRTTLNDFDNTKEQPVLNVIYENNDTTATATTSNNNNNSNRSNNSNDSAESHGEHMFESQLDSFEMEHIALQSDNEIDIGLDTGNSANMASILARSANEEHRLSISVARAENTNSSGGERSCMQTVVLITGQHLPGKESTRSSQVEMEEASKEISRKQCAIDPMLITREFRGAAAQHLKSLSKGRTVSPESPDIGKSDPNKVSRGESLLQCHMCDLQGFTAVGLKEHLKIHRGTKEYQCTECSSTFCTNGGLNRHSKIHVNKQSWKCPMCEESFSSRLELRSHGRVHGTSIWNSRCSGINDGPGNGPVSLEVDLPLNDALVDPDSTVSEKVLLDTVAEKQVMERVENEERKERKEYTNKCKYCPKTFRKPSDLIRHVRTHTGERPYKCDYCSKSFAVKCTLDSHTKVHTGKKTFRCHVCSSLFATKGSLKVHMRLHTGSKPFKCPVCDSRFRTSGHRKVHLMKHAREHKNSPKRKQKHLKIAAIAEVAAADFITRAESERKMSNYEEQQQQQQQQQHSGYSHFETINVETAATCLTDQISFDAETVLPNSNPILSVNEGSQLVANLHFLLTNGLVTIQPEETILPQSITNSSHDERPTRIVSDASACIPTLSIASSSENGKDEMSVGERSKEQLSPTTYQFHSNGCVLTVASASAATQATQLEPFSKIALEKASSSAVIRKTSIKGNSAKKECDVCGKAFTKPYQVERHKRIHTGERPYKCDLCSKSFAQKSTLQMHQKHHTGDRPYPCPHCEYSFTQKGNLRTHMKRVHQLDGIDAKKLKRTRQPVVLPKSLQNTPTLAKGLNLDDISSFVEFLK